MTDVPKTNLLDLDRDGLERFFAEELGEKRFRAHQIMKWIYHQHVTDFGQMTDVGKALRAKLEARAEIRPPSVHFDKPSADGTHKWLLGMDQSNAIETVFIPDKGRGTLCVSSQVGCGLNCQFCSTATQGFNRNLSTAEIIGQVWIASKHLGNKTHQQRKLTNVVMMGMGEPLLNFDNVVRAMSLMRDDLGFGLANKRVTLSTAGLVPMIDRLGDEADVSLAVSLHAPNDALRTELVPLNKKYPVAELMEACVRYLGKRKKGESITFEYTLMKGVNDSPATARELARLMRQFSNRMQYADAAKVNLIPFNPFPGTRFERSGETEIRAFQKLLLDAGVLTMVRRTRGDDIDAACGQLKGQVMDKTRRQATFKLKNTIPSTTQTH
ncbi:dual-specificity RNA methyltransferase RlmN [Arenimonas maotaiensis]|uniref:Dual-specificity RNA methyltransferase RlmN n=1 Tax=Arenimonas maotaiensis TaxID=1446479 RepID=A0A917CC13_9GAMM|nr:23S rRNA (adenine(2503)-C(2))-methyltransferase RlmN [Arenimonas maotaiensis]GGF82454.1 dual-specificity RNA methyltransferase RlmN [Arenimonas maotaiensis]